jgi:hypothetical protein
MEGEEVKVIRGPARGRWSGGWPQTSSPLSQTSSPLSNLHHAGRPEHGKHGSVASLSARSPYRKEVQSQSSIPEDGTRVS